MSINVLGEQMVGELFAIHVYLYHNECSITFAKRYPKTHITIDVPLICGDFDWIDLFKFIAFFEATHVIISERISS